MTPASNVGWGTALSSSLGVLPVLAISFGGGAMSPLLLGLSVPTLLGGIVLALAGRRRARQQFRKARDRWITRCESLVSRCRIAAQQQRLALDRLHPATTALLDLAARHALFERRADDPDALTVCVGSGAVAAHVRLAYEPPDGEIDAELASIAEAAAGSTQELAAAPLCVSLRDVKVLVLQGKRAETRSLAAALVAQLVALHHPADLALAIVGAQVDWGWAANLPHVRISHQGGQIGNDPATATAWQPTTTSVSDRVLVIDGYVPERDVALDAALARGDVLAIVTCTGLIPPRVGALLDLAGSTLVVDRADAVHLVSLEHLSPADGAILSRFIDVPDPLPPPDLAELLRRDPLGDAGDLRTVVGGTPDGEPVWLDLREASLGGDGPHGLLVGATGSGKSVALQTVVTGLASRLSPDHLALLLVDFKGGAAFDPVARLPHVAGLVTNLDSNPDELRRIAASLDAEIERRQRILRRESEATFPSLLVVVDEAGELLTAVPEFIDLFTRIGRIGRSLRIHLLLATQRWDEGKLRSLDAHLRLRLCLRTFTADDSRAVLGNDAAIRLPAAPGAGILSVDGHAGRVDVVAVSQVISPRPGPSVRPVWRPPLPPHLDLASAELISGDQTADEVSISGASIGLIDVPEQQTYRRLHLDLRGAGHVAIVGGPRSGVSTALHTIAIAVGAQKKTSRVAAHVIDLSGRAVALRSLPRVGTYLGPDADSEWIVHVIAGIRELVEERWRNRAGNHEPTLLFIDGFALLRHVAGDDPAVDTALLGIANRGHPVGVHLILGARRWADVRPALLACCGMRWELRLDDPSESHAGRVTAATVPRIPGRGLLQDGRQFQIAIALAQHEAPGETSRSEPLVTPILPLPQRICVPPGVGDGAFPLGVTGRRRELVFLDLLRPGAHLLVAGDPGTGRSTVLRRIASHLGSASPGQVELTLIDPRRKFDAPTVSRPNDIVDQLRTLARDLAAAFDSAQESGTAAASHATSGGGRRRIVLIDDAALLDAGPYRADPASAANAVADLARFLPWSDLLGFHLVVVRPPGAGRVGIDPLGAALRSAGAVELLLAGDHDGLGRRASAVLPPGRARLIRSGEPVITLQCFDDQTPLPPGHAAPTSPAGAPAARSTST